MRNITLNDMKYRIKTKNGELLLDSYAVRRLLFSNELRKGLQEVAEPIARRAGPDNVVEMMNGHDRCRAIVKTTSEAAAKKNVQNNTLLKAVGK